jgi:hypothetical protein
MVPAVLCIKSLLELTANRPAVFHTHLRNEQDHWEDTAWLYFVLGAPVAPTATT